jgi:hypothetical protein
MEIEKFLELTQGLEKKKKAKKEDLERFKKFFERFHNLNRAYQHSKTLKMMNHLTHAGRLRAPSIPGR